MKKSKNTYKNDFIKFIKVLKKEFKNAIKTLLKKRLRTQLKHQ